MDAGGITYAEAVREFKRRFLLQVLTRHKGNQCKAAEDLQIHRNTLSRMIAELGIDPAETRAENRSGSKRPVRSASSPALEIKRTGSDAR